MGTRRRKRRLRGQRRRACLAERGEGRMRLAIG
jgi:hypothetical protein